jgi:hypothetical protein
MPSPPVLRVDIQTGRVLANRLVDVYGKGCAAQNKEERAVSEKTLDRSRFTYFAPRCTLSRGSVTVSLSRDLVEFMDSIAKPPPTHFVIGVDKDGRAIDIRPINKNAFGAIELARYPSTTIPPEFRSETLADWLESMGVPTEVEVRYDKESGDILGQWEEKAAEIAAPVIQVSAVVEEAIPCTAEVSSEHDPIPYALTEKTETVEIAPPVKPEAPVAELPAGMIPATPKRRLNKGKPTDGTISHVGGHRWVESPYVSPNGIPLYTCEVCGMYTSNLSNPQLGKRPCYPGLYKDCYTLGGNAMMPIPGTFKPEAIADRLARLKEEAANVAGAASFG